MFSNCFNGIFQLIHLYLFGQSRPGHIGNFRLDLGKKPILFGIGNEAKFLPQNQVIQSPDSPNIKFCI